MHTPNHHHHMQMHPKLTTQKSPPSFTPINPRSSYQQQNANYFQKLQEQLLQKSNRYTSLIGKKFFPKHPSHQLILHKTSHSKNPTHTSSQQQNKPSKNNSFIQLQIGRKDTLSSSLQKTLPSEEQIKFRIIKNPSEFISSHPRTNFHTQKEPLQHNKGFISRQQTERTHNIDQLKEQQKFQQPLLHFQSDFIPNKTQKPTSTKSADLKSKIDHIKEVISKFSNSKILKVKQKAKDSPLELQRKLVYNLTCDDKHPKSLEDLHGDVMHQSMMRKHVENQENFSSKLNKDNLSSTISTKISINHNSNECSKISVGKKQHDHAEAQQYVQENSLQKAIIYRVNYQKDPPPLNIKKLTPQPDPNKSSLKSSIKRSKPISIKDFTILSQIGQGKTGTVYLAKHTESNLLCALKVINRQILTPQVIVQLMRQIQIQFYLDHPNIVQLYAFFSDQSHIYLMLELCYSGNLYTHLRKQKILTETEIRPVIRQVCYALEFMHSNDIIHRDLKPENILFHESVVKICDFGWAVYSPLPRDTLCGTPIYASPQLVEKKKYNSKIDVWNVGVMTYELLCGRVPFEIRSDQDLYKVVSQQIHFPKSIPVSEFCKDFINSCLKKQPEKRKTISELLEHPFLNENFP